MEYINPTELENQYPSPEITLQSSYVGDVSSITYSGKYPKNFLKFDTVPLDDIKLGELKSDPIITFRFIVRFEDGDDTDDWTSAEFLQDLHKGVQENQPFFNRDRVTLVTINFTELKDYWKSDKFTIAEEYAQVEVIESLTTKEKIIKHINWIVGAVEKLRPVQSFGKWLPEPGVSIEVEEDIFATTDQPVPVTSISDDSIITNSSIVNPPITNINFYPFRTAGEYEGEIRKFNDDVFYRWINSTWKPRIIKPT